MPRHAGKYATGRPGPKAAGWIGGLLLALHAALAAAQDLGTVGPVWEIEEQDLLQVIQARASDFIDSGRWQEKQKEMQARARAYLAHPPGIRLPRAGERRRRTFDPSLEVPYDIRDAEGKVLYPAGTRVNPLDVVSLSAPLLFIDATDDDQVRYASALAKQDPLLRIILVDGPYVDTARRLQRRIWFDQRGYIAGQLGLEAVPTLVYQEKKRLVLEEIPPEAAP